MENGKISLQPDVTNSMIISKFLKWFADFKKRYKMALIIDIVNLALSVVCVILYIYSTYEVKSFSDKQSLIWYNFFARIYFLTDFLISVFSIKTDSKLTFYIYVFNGMKNDYTSAIFMVSCSVVTLRIWRVEYLSKYIQSEVNRKLFTITCSIFSLLVFSTALINVVENTQTVGTYWLFLPQDCPEYLACPGSNDSFHSSFFFIMTTISTLGYYSNIKSVAGRIVIIGLIVVSIIQIPSKCSELMTLLASKSIYSRTTYRKLDKVNFILITGSISYFSLLDLLQEYFHVDHGENEKHALILMPQRPDPNMKSLLQEYQNKLFYFEGDPLKESDLKRCQFKDASTILILCNKQTDDSNAEDSKTILQAMAIRKYLMQDEETTKKEGKNQTKMLIQLLRPESELHFALSISKKNNLDQILCIDELKLSLLAKSCLCNGIISLISNLIMTSNLENINKKLKQNNEWLEDYKTGKGFEIYKISLDNLRGYQFEEICEMIYLEKKIILFGLNVNIILLYIICLDRNKNRWKLLSPFKPK
jgi:hypothetical protein